MVSPRPRVWVIGSISPPRYVPTSMACGGCRERAGTSLPPRARVPRCIGPLYAVKRILGRFGQLFDIPGPVPCTPVAAQDLLFAATHVMVTALDTSIAASGASFATYAMSVAALDAPFAMSARGIAANGRSDKAKATPDLSPATILTASGTRGQTKDVHLAA